MQLLSNQAQKVEQKDNKMERPPPPIPWGLSAPRPWPSRAPSEKNQVEQEEDKKTKQKEDTEKPGVKASVCLDPDTPDDEEQNEKDMAVDHWQKEGDEKKKKKEQVEQEKDQRTKVEKDKDFKKTKEKVEKVKDQRKKVEKEKDHKKEKEKEKDKVGISSSTTISSSTRSSSSTGISKETVEHQPQKKQKVEQEKKEVDMAATKSKMSSELPPKQRNQWDPNTCQWEPKGTVGEELARGKAVAKCEAFPAAESRADMRKEKARQLKATKHWAPVPGEKEFENVRRMSIAATQREEAQMRTPSPQRGSAPSRSRAPSPERREPYAEAVARSACRAASATCGSDDRRPEMPLPIRGIPAPDDTRLPMTHVEPEAKRAALAPPAAGKRIRSSSKTRAEALQERDLNSRLAAVDEYVGTLDDQKLENLKDTLNQIFRAGKVKLVPRGSASSSGFSTEEKLDSFADEIREIAREHRLDVVIISDIAKRDRQKRRRKRKH